MTDSPETPDPSPEAVAAEPAGPSRRPAPGAAAASRARRIGGGRPVTTSAPERPAEPEHQPEPERPPAAPAPESPEAGADAVPEVDLTKRAAPRAGKTLPIGDGEPAAVPPWLNWAPAGVLAAGCVVMAVLIVIFSHGVWWGPDRGAPPSQSTVAKQREQVLAAAKSCVVAANDYDYRSLAAYEKRALACTTGALTSKLKRTIEDLIMKNGPDIKAKQATTITRGGIETVTPDGKQWTLLVFGQLSVVNTKFPQGRTDPFGAEVRMEKAHGKWVMSQLTVVSSPVQSS